TQRGQRRFVNGTCTQQQKNRQSCKFHVFLLISDMLLFIQKKLKLRLNSEREPKLPLFIPSAR
uniref:hypothetical protein n=1 Tax=Candidatus Scatocola faecipullorum TaxID=2840917 RepID=UPI004024ABF9